MYLYNITYNISEEIHEKWLHWMRTIHIHEVINTSHFIGAKLIKVLIEEEMGGVTYSVQYQVENKDILENYHKNYHALFVEKMNRLFIDNYVNFSTELLIIEEFNSFSSS